MLFGGWIRLVSILAKRSTPGSVFWGRVNNVPIDSTDSSSNRLECPSTTRPQEGHACSVDHTLVPVPESYANSYFVKFLLTMLVCGSIVLANAHTLPKPSTDGVGPRYCPSIFKKVNWPPVTLRSTFFFCRYSYFGDL